MGWTASIQISKTDDGYFHVYAPVSGDTADEAKAGAEYVLNSIASGKSAFIRTKPESHSDMDFDTKETRHDGLVRFSYRDEPGEWKYSIPDEDMPLYVGLSGS
jgi:hypothetical protein